MPSRLSVARIFATITISPPSPHAEIETRMVVEFNFLSAVAAWFGADNGPDF